MHERVNPYPASEITSLVILIFLSHPWHNSSRVHASFLSIGLGFFLAVVVDCENIIGVLPPLWLVTFDNEGRSLGVLVHLWLVTFSLVFVSVPLILLAHLAKEA